MTTHKTRADWFQSRTSYPNREIFPRDLNATRGSAGLAWQEVGPFSSGGRLTCLAVHPKVKGLIYAGSAAGGVWKSEDFGLNWKPAWGRLLVRKRPILAVEVEEELPTCNIGALALDPSDPERLYCGTGEANLSGDNYPGTGLYCSVDRGETWRMVGGIESKQEDFLLFPRLGIPRRIGSIAIDPSSPSHIFLGGVSHSDQDVAGLFERNPDSRHWQIAQDNNNIAKGEEGTLNPAIGNSRTVFISKLNYFCHSVVFHPRKPLVLFAAVEARGTQSGIWISENGGISWRQAKDRKLPSGDRFGRTSIAVSPNSDVVWALAAEQGTKQFLGLFLSKDLGKTWDSIPVPALAQDGQLSYTNCIAVHPKRPMTCIVGSLNLHQTVNGGRSWKQISDWKLARASDGYVHEDHHAVVIDAEGVVYSANDGGFAVRMEKKGPWQTRNNGLAASMFYDLDVDMLDSNRISGGTQDMGIWFQGPLDTAQRKSGVPFEFRRVHTGDGGWTCYDPQNPDNPLASRIKMEVLRHVGNNQWMNLTDGIPEEERHTVFQTVIAMSRGPLGGASGLYIGSTRLWESIDFGESWTPLSVVFDGSIITAIEVPSHNPAIVYVGTTNGGFYRGDRMRKGGRNFRWSRNLAGPLSPGRTITRIATNPLNADHVLYSVGSVAECVTSDKDEAAPSLLNARAQLYTRVNGVLALLGFDHVYESHDRGGTWEDTGGSLPNLPHNAVTFASYNLVFAAHDMGVAVRKDFEWLDISLGLPRVRVTDLAYHQQDEVLFVSTYGRGIWKIAIWEVNEWIENWKRTAPPPDTPERQLQLQRAQTPG